MKPKQLLYATTNPSKVTRMRELVGHLPLHIASLRDLNRQTQIIEDGKTPEENACKKAEFHFQEVGMSTIAVDYGLYIDRFTENKQPGLLVRRVFGPGVQVTDEEMLLYYQTELDKVGGKSKGKWITAVALKSTPETICYDTFWSETSLTSTASEILMPGEPLNSLQIDPISQKYFSEMSPEERITAQKQRASGIVDFIERNLDKI